MNRSAIAILVALALALTACSGISTPTLDGTEWLSVSRTDGGEDWPLVEGTRIRLRFDDGGVSASAGCNTIGGTYRVDGGRLTVGDLATTEIGCDEARHTQDEWLAALLGSQPTLTVGDAKLTLVVGDDVLTFESREVAEPDLPLIGTTWSVESLIGGDAASSVPGGVVATIVFRDDGTTEVDTGCNTGSGRYEIDGTTLRVRELFTTLIGCDAATGQLEAAVLGVLNAETIEIAVEASTLTLTAGDRGLGLRGD